MTALLIAVLTSSLLGSTHCAGMCGAFLAAAIHGGHATSKWQKARLQAFYHAGRLMTYLAFGSIAGLIGSAVEIVGHAAGVSRAAAIGAGIVMVGFGAVAIAREMGVRVPRAPVPGFMQNALIAGHNRVWGWGSEARALALGLMTTLLPCGWLYAFLVVAAGTKTVPTALLVMAVFWVGTLPVMALLGAGLQALTGAGRRWLPVATSVAVIVVGVATIFGRMGIPTEAMATLAQPSSSASSLNALDPLNLPCHNR